MKMIQGQPRRLTLRGWAALEDFTEQISEQAEEGNILRICSLIFQHLDLANETQKWEDIDWMDVADLFVETQNINKLNIKAPMLAVKSKDSEKQPWEYPGRKWFFWLNLFASAYGWNSDTVGGLDPDDAVGLYQEIRLDQQMREEWEWSLSEIAYPYNPATKKSKYSPLPRPEWMRRTMENYKPKKIVTTKIRKDMIPVGIVINLDES